MKTTSMIKNLVLFVILLLNCSIRVDGRPVDKLDACVNACQKYLESNKKDYANYWLSSLFVISKTEITNYTFASEIKPFLKNKRIAIVVVFSDITKNKKNLALILDYDNPYCIINSHPIVLKTTHFSDDALIELLKKQTSPSAMIKNLCNQIKTNNINPYCSYKKISGISLVTMKNEYYCSGVQIDLPPPYWLVHFRLNANFNTPNYHALGGEYILIISPFLNNVIRTYGFK